MAFPQCSCLEKSKGLQSLVGCIYGVTGVGHWGSTVAACEGGYRSVLPLNGNTIWARRGCPDRPGKPQTVLSH